MTTFLDGPAKGQRLMLKNSPQQLRVVFDVATNTWDALDQPGDEPKHSEMVFDYELKERKGTCHIYKRGGGGGFYPISEYVYKGADE